MIEDKLFQKRRADIVYRINLGIVSKESTMQKYNIARCKRTSPFTVVLTSTSKFRGADDVVFRSQILPSRAVLIASQSQTRAFSYPLLFGCCCLLIDCRFAVHPNLMGTVHLLCSTKNHVRQLLIGQNRPFLRSVLTFCSSVHRNSVDVDATN